MADRTHDWSGKSLAGGRYLVVAKLGEGGMGAVYRARDANIDADVVIKAPLRSMLEDAEFASRFTREIRSLVKLSHPRIVKVTDVGEHEGLPFAVMQHLPGGSLEDRQPTGPGAMRWADDPTVLSGWIGGIAEALDYVHSQGYVHRDVKPGNILFDDQGHSFLGDFGVVKVLTSTADANASRDTMTGGGMLLGTPEYMAPELIMGEPVDGRVDQYALGVTVYEVLSGRRPFEDEVKTKLLVLQTSRPPPPLDELCPWVARPLSEVVHRALTKDPDGRFPSCAELARAVARAIKAEHAGRPARIRSRCRSCDRILTLTPADFARMKQSPGRMGCPSCKTPIAGPADAAANQAHSRTQVEPGTPPRRATVVVPAGAAGGTVAIDPQAKGSTVAINPQAKGSTVAIDPRASTQKLPPPPPQGTPRAGTVILDPRDLGRSPDAADPLAISLGEDVPLHSKEPSPRANGIPLPWVVAGGSVAASILLVGLVLVGLRPVAAPAVPAPPVVASTTAQPVRSPRTAEAPPTSAPPRSEPVQPPAAAGSPAKDGPGAVATLARASATPGPVAPANVPTGPSYESRTASPFADPLLAASPTGTRPPAPPPAPAPPPSDVPPASVADTVPVADTAQELDEVPLKGSVQLEKILASPGDFAQKTVVLTDIYCIADTVVPHDGWVSLGIIESDLDLQVNKGRGSLRVGHWKTFDLAVEPELARRLSSRRLINRISSYHAAGSGWVDKLAIVTVAVRKPPVQGMSPCQIVKLEFATHVAPEIVTIAKKRRLKVIYRTLTVSPAGEQEGRGKDEEWAPKTGRLRHITTQFNKLIDAQKRMASDAQWNQFNAQFNNMLSQGIKNAIRQDAIDQMRTRQERIPPQFR